MQRARVTASDLHTTSLCSTRRPAPTSAEPSTSPPRSADTGSRTTNWWTKCWPRSRASAAPCRCWHSLQHDCGSGVTRRAVSSPGRRIRRSAASAARWPNTPRPPSIASVSEQFPSSASSSATSSPPKAPAPSANGTNSFPFSAIRASESPAAVLRALIDARLLTSYEIHEDEQEPTRRVEIIHESLLANWPRLVRWQTQDADAAQLRDQLRQAAKTWDEHDRSDDMLWTGSAYREFAVWRERYPGGLTGLEEAFAAAMTVLSGRRRRRRRIAVAAALVIAALITATTTALWQRGALQERRAEAANLLSLGQIELESYPSAAVAHAIASLELADGSRARLLALEALWKGPAAFVASEGQVWDCTFSPDGERLVQRRVAPVGSSRLSVISADGSSRYFETEASASAGSLSRISNTGHFVSYGSGANETWEHGLWSVREERRLANIRYKEPAYTRGIAEDTNRGRHVLLVGKRPGCRRRPRSQRFG